MNDVPQGSVLEAILLNVFLSDIGIWIECTLSKFMDDTKLTSAVNILEGRDVIQKDLGRFEEWSNVKPLKFNGAKYNPQYHHRLSG